MHDYSQIPLQEMNALPEPCQARERQGRRLFWGVGGCNETSKELGFSDLPELNCHVKLIWGDKQREECVRSTKKCISEPRRANQYFISSLFLPWDLCISAYTIQSLDFV